VILSFLLGLVAGGLLGAYWTRPGGWLGYTHGHGYPYYGNYGPTNYAPPYYYPYSTGSYNPYYSPYYRSSNYQPYYLPYYPYYLPY